MAKKTPAKRNPQDSTSRNVKAANKRLRRLEELMDILSDKVYRLEHPQAVTEEPIEPTAPASEPA